MIANHSEYFEDMSLKIFIVVFLAGWCADGNGETLYVSEFNNYCLPVRSRNNTISHGNSCCLEQSCYGSFDQALAKVKSNDVINITTNSTLSFFHILKGLQNIQIIGYKNPTVYYYNDVYCYNSSIIIGALQFNSCTNCTIQGITWSGCGGIIQNNNYPVLEFYNSSNVKIEKCIFKRSKGQAIVLLEITGDVTINDCQFYDNKYLGNAGGAVIDITKQRNYQMSVTIRNCAFTDNVGTRSIINIDQSTNGKISFHDFTFSNNIGTAIYLNHQDLYLYGEAYFKNNTARKNGGGMFVTNNSHVYFDENSSIEFSQNSANDSGGAIFLSNNSTISLGKTSNFINNKAINDGGAIALRNNAHINNIISGNSSAHGDALFSNNSANSGGAISLNSYSTFTFGSNSTFVNNTANKSGAIALHDNCNITNEEDSIVKFVGNIAQETGGALHLSMNSKTCFTHNVIVSFNENSANSSNGAVIFLESFSNITSQGNSTVAFNKNSPPNRILYAINNSFVTATLNVTFNDQVSQWYYGNSFTESNDVIINIEGIVRCSDYREYYICSDNQTCSCKHIADISNNSEVSITDDLIINPAINLEMLDNISFIGFNNATITGELEFMSCRNLEIKGLTWIQPSRNNPKRNNPKRNSKLTLSRVYNTTVSNCSFQNLTGQVISLSHVSGYINFIHCNFMHNEDGISEQANDTLLYYKPDNTDDITMLTIENCRFSKNEYSSLIFLKPSFSKSHYVVLSDSVFTDNQGHCIYENYQNLHIEKTVSFINNYDEVESGAGIYITNNSRITFCNNSNVTFYNNRAVNNHGGAIFADNSHIVIQNSSHLVFSNNEAIQGGAVYSTNTSIITLEENSIMELLENKATQNGGAIYSNTNCKVLLNGTSSFRSNRAIKGGAIYSQDNSEIKFQNNARGEFEGNDARNGEENYGGALYLDSSSIKFAEDSKITFNKNLAYGGHGGAIYSNSSNVTFMDSSEVRFCDNEMFNGDGGAIFFAGESDARFQGMSAVTFTSNRARDGGALHFQNSSIGFTDNSRVEFSRNIAIQDGGGIYLYEINILFDDSSNVNFTDNNAERGAGIYAEMNCMFTSEGNSNIMFSYNTASVHGAGVYLISNSNLFIIESSKVMMLENRATENGGGIYSQTNSQILFGSNISIILGNNKATQGGAIYSNADSNVTFQSPATITFTQNEASSYGGSLHLEDNSRVKFKGDSTVTYYKNKASNGNGGAIYCTHNSVVLIQDMSNVTFNENTAIDGGALYLQFESNIVFHNNSMATFNNNMATTSGGAINFETDSQGVFGGTTTLLFCSNSATKSGGAMYLRNNVSLSFEKFSDNGNPSNTSNMFSHNYAETGGAIFLMNSEIQNDNNSVIFDNNAARQDGGAIYSDQSNLTFINDCNIKFSNNNANDNGGAIYGIFANNNALNINSTNVEFEKNNARIAGDSIYINLPQGCGQGCLNSSILGNVDGIIEHITTPPNELKLYAPTRCIHTDNEEFDVYYIDNIMLGQEIRLDACMYDYYNKEADAALFLISAYSTGNDKYDAGNDIENFTLGLNTTSISCNHTISDIRINAKKDKPTLPYNYTMNLALFANRFSESKRVFADLTVELSECHEGFYYNERACQCYDTENIVFCTDSSSTIRRGYWFGEVDNKPTVAFCPINYCNFSCCETSNGFYQLSPTRENQCRSHRVGVACGKCEQGYILPYDSPDCIKASDCTTTYISLAVTLTVIYWVFLFVIVFILMHFKVELGYLYGVTYYYSIIDIMLSQNLQLSNEFFTVMNILSSVAKVTPQFLGQFCLFKEMSGIDQQFIHYVHPVAFSLILVMIIMLAKFSGRLTVFISRAIIPIICFLLLLSYTSIATTSLLLMRPLRFQDIDKVYTYLSPDLEYFHGRHLGYAILAIVSTIAIVIFLPTLLALEPYLNRYINFVKVKPILDQFQGCYKDKYRSFAAYYMICRLVIITLIIANSSSDNFVIQYSLITICVIIALVHLIIRPYSQTVLNVLDGIILIMMILIAMISYFKNYDSNLVVSLAYILVLLPLIIFIAMELSINKENVKKMIQTIKSFKLRKQKSKNKNEIPLNDVNHEIGIIVDDSMRRNALIVDV